jgi:hypothetical protein
LTILTNTFTTPSAAGVPVTGSMTGARFMRLTSGTSFQGSLPETGGVLFNGSLFGPPTYAGLPVTFDFGSPVVGFGFDIQNGFFGPFTATVTAFYQGGLFDTDAGQTWPSPSRAASLEPLVVSCPATRAQESAARIRPHHLSTWDPGQLTLRS